MPVSVFRRFTAATSSQHKKGRDSHSPPAKEDTKEVRKSSSYRSLLNRLHPTSSDPTINSTGQHNSRDALPMGLLLAVIDRCQLIQQCRLRSVCRAFRDHVDANNAKISFLDVSRRELSSCEGELGWQKHPSASLLLRQSSQRLQIVVNARWTAGDIRTVVGVMATFRKHVMHADIDAPIAELLIASLSVLDLNRWFAFQCYMKALNMFDEDVHLNCVAKKTNEEIYWPELRTLTIRTTMQQAPHLSRVIDYGVAASFVINRLVISSLSVVVLDGEDDDSASGRLNKNIYNFRCWAGSAGFDGRFHISTTREQEMSEVH